MQTLRSILQLAPVKSLPTECCSIFQLGPLLLLKVLLHLSCQLEHLPVDPEYLNSC